MNEFLQLPCTISLKSFIVIDPRYENDTELSKYTCMWNLEASSLVFGRWKALQSVCRLLKKKLCLIKANYNKTLKFNRRSELFAKCRHTEKFHAGKFKSVRDRRTRVSKKLCVEHSSIYSMTKHLLYINLAAAGGIFCLHRLSYSS